MLLEKALYGCVNTAALRHANQTATMEGDGFIPSPYDSCVLNTHEPKDEQVTVAIHVDDLFITSKSEDNHLKIEECMRDKYKEIKISKGKVVDYIGMTLDYIVPGQVTI